MQFENTLDFARGLDKKDSLKKFRSMFNIPRVNGKPSIYFTGNSLGLQPKNTKKFVIEELDDWAKLGVEGHVHSRRPWLYYHKFTKKGLAALTGAKPSEVVAMNQLTVNLHLMLVTFYRPTAIRFKILTETGPFSSDQYAFDSHIKLHGFKPEEAIVELKPRPGEHSLRTADMLTAMQQNKDQLALIIMGGVQY
jgi:kynureninase